MVVCVRVKNAFYSIMCTFASILKLLDVLFPCFPSVTYRSDIDECSSGSHDCHQNAFCVMPRTRNIIFLQVEGLLVTYEKKAEETLVIVVFPSEKVKGKLTLHWRFYNNRRQEKMSMFSISVANFVNHYLL